MANLPHLAQRLFGAPLLLTPDKAEILVRVFEAKLRGDALGFDDDEGASAGAEASKPYDLRDGIAEIPIEGTLVHKSSGMRARSGMRSYGQIGHTFDAAMSDPDVHGLLLRFDSPGGEVNGVFDLADKIHAARDAGKPIFAVADENMYSAAYALGSAAHRIIVPRTGGVGSVGVVAMHVDQSGLDDKMGLKYTFISAGDKKTLGNPHEPLADEGRDQMQERVDATHDLFVRTVARNRGMTLRAVRDTQAGLYFGQDAVDEGLADEVGTAEDARRALSARISAARPSEDQQDNEPPFQDDDGDGGDDAPWGTAHAAIALAAAAPSAAIYAKAIPYKATPTVEGAWDGPLNESRLREGESAAYYRSAYAWVDASKDGTKKSHYKFIHHEVSEGGEVGAANVEACRAGIAAINGARGGTRIPDSDKKGVYRHLARHLEAAKVEPPKFKSLAFVDSLQLRTFAAARMEGGAGAQRVTGCPVPYRRLSGDLGGFREEYAPGCFAESATGDDVRALVDHTRHLVLGRTTSGTLRLRETQEGLLAEIDLPDTSYAKDLVALMRRGDVAHMSAAFYIERQQWETRNGERVRVVLKGRLVEVSVTAFAAYDSTTAEAGNSPGAINLARERLRLERARLATA